MFRKYYKSANDEIRTNRELIDKIFDEYAEVQSKQNKAKIYSFCIRYGTAFAAVLVLCAVLAVYPKFEKLNQEPALINENYEYKIENVNEPKEKSDMGNDATDYSKETNVKSVDTRVVADEISEPVTARLVQSGIEESENSAMIILNCQADISKLQPVTESEVELATKNLVERLGTADENTGNIYSFEITGKLEADGNTYYLGRWRWLVDDHSSLLCEFVLSDDLTCLYECIINGNTVSWTTKTNMFE